MLIAINIILGKISVGPAFSAVNFGFISLVLAGYLYGVKLTMLAAVLANLLAFTIMGSGAFSFWFVIPAAIAGATYGLLHKPSLFRIFIVNIVVVVGVSFLFNTSLIAYVDDKNIQDDYESHCASYSNLYVIESHCYD